MPSAISCSSLSNRFCPRRGRSPLLYDSGSSRAAQSRSKMDQERDIQSEQHHFLLARACSGATLGIRQGRCLEEPRLGTTLVDLPASMSSISLEIEALIAELRENDGEEQIALRIVADKSESNGSVGHVERLVSRL